jgi:CRP-like cAMP-binding protein
MDMLAMTPVHLMAIKKTDIKALFAKFPKIAVNVAGVLAAKVRRDSSLVEVLSFDQVISRLARLIMKQTDAEKSLLPLFTQQDLAAMVGTSRVVVNRSLKAMEDQGAIRLERRRIVVTDREILEDLVK